MRENKWNLTLPLLEARKNDEVISLADSLVLRWIDELNGITDADETARQIKAEIRRLRKEPNSVANKRKIRQLYARLDEVQFKPDYMCLIIDKKKDYYRACQGFSINGLRYHRLLGTNGGVKNETIVFVSERHWPEISRRIDNGRDMTREMVPAKLEAYKALTCSASIPVSYPQGILVVNDCEVEFKADTIYLDDEGCDEPIMEYRPDVAVQVNDSDGYGLMSPALAARWSEELGLDYVMSGANTRCSWEKGMVFAFDFVDFAENVARQYMVIDAWGDEVDIRNVELILTTSMLKLWDSYSSCDDYISKCIENRYTFSITKTTPRELESERTLNYQFIQSYDLSDDDIEELIRPTIDEIHDILHADWAKTVLYLKGVGLNENNVAQLEDDYAKALMIEPKMIDDPYVQANIYQMIQNRIKRAKVGVIKVHGNYSIICGDPYALCQSIFGLPVTGLLKAGEIYSKYWNDIGADKLACFRAPMTCHNNIRKVVPHKSEDAAHWYRYMTACTLMNCWDTATHALNGADKDGDLVMLTDNRILVERHQELPAIMCVQRKAQKKIVTESDAIEANIGSFGDDIGKTTNWITTMFEVQARFPKDSEEYKTLEYRIMSGQLLQQNSIDKAKGIVAQPMPRTWYDRHSVNKIEDPDRRRFYQNIVADRKPYFMRYIYPTLMRQYNTYIKNTNKNCLREFRLTMAELLAKPEDELSDRQKDFIRYYHSRMPVGTSDCVMNRICRRFEEEFDGYIRKNDFCTMFDRSIMKSGRGYTAQEFNAIARLYGVYTKRLENYMVYADYERVDRTEVAVAKNTLRDECVRGCAEICPDSKALCDILLDICYRKSSSKRFAWEVCGNEIISNLLERNQMEIKYPAADSAGDIEFGGRRFAVKSIVIGGNEWES